MALEPVLVPQPVARGRRGAVVGPHHLATAAGLAILRAGGHAVDAAIATNAVLGVVQPNDCGPGGDAFWLIWDASERRQLGLNGSGRAPSGVDPARLRGGGLAAMPERGAAAITIPGAVRSWADAHRRFGRLDAATILAAAIDLAAAGFPAWPGFMSAVEATAPLVGSAVGATAPWFEAFRPLQRPWRLGELVRLPALARTLETLARDGFDAFYDGPLGEAQAGGLLAAGVPCRLDDLRDHRSTWTEPISTSYRGVTVTSHAPNSSGVVALELISILERFEPPPAAAFGPHGVTDPGWIHLGVEAAKLAMADRDAHLTDPDAMTATVGELLDPGRIEDLARRIDPGRAARPARATNPPGGGTVYLGVVDDDGNAVSLIQSNYQDFGSGVVDPATGVVYQNRGAYFSLDPDHPNVLGPGRRTLHTLLPGMLFRAAGGDPWVVAGSMGADAQPQIHAQLVSALVDGRVDVGTAVAAPRWYVAPERRFEPPLTVRAESRFEPGVLEALEALGHPVARTPAFDESLGHEHAIELVDGGPRAPGGSLAAATDPRSAGLPAVW